MSRTFVSEDSDGIADLVVLRRNGNRILRGLGKCEFEDATAKLGVEPGRDWTVGFSATWEGGNALPTLAFGSAVSAVALLGCVALLVVGRRRSPARTPPDATAVTPG